MSLITNQKLSQFEESESGQARPGVVSWSPPQPNWNPWSSCNIDEGPLASVRIFCALSFPMGLDHLRRILLNSSLIPELLGLCMPL